MANLGPHNAPAPAHSDHPGDEGAAPRRIAFFLYGLSGGGVPRRTVTLANAFAAQGDSVDMVVLDAENPYGHELAPGIRLVPLPRRRFRLPFRRSKRRHQFANARPALERYLAAERPSVVISADNYANLTALDARDRSGVPVPIIVTQRTHTSTYAAGKPRLIKRIRRTYPQADAIVGVSRAIIDDLRTIGVPARNMRTIYNPVIAGNFDELAARPVAHPWFQAGQPPVVLGVGRLSPQKDFPTLIRAFARARRQRPNLRLVILGEAQKPDDREGLLRLAAELEIADAVDIPGPVPQAIPYMARAGLVALTSRFEGMPGVLIEALACGTPVVSTNCPSGPDEVLEDGRYGPLLPMGDPEAVADAMLSTLANPIDRQTLVARGRFFSAGESLRQYSDLIDELTGAARST